MVYKLLKWFTMVDKDSSKCSAILQGIMGGKLFFEGFEINVLQLQSLFSFKLFSTSYQRICKKDVVVKFMRNLLFLNVTNQAWCIKGLAIVSN